jgi:hypothetical protein
MLLKIIYYLDVVSSLVSLVGTGLGAVEEPI